MATKIVTKNSSTASAVPTASDLVQGELAVNVADKRLFTEDNTGTIVELGTNPSTIDINAGSIDGTTIGASSASTGAFTTLTATGLTVDTDTLYVDSTNNRVGIGTTSPNQKLHINDASPFARLESTSTSYNGFTTKNDSGNFYFGIDDSGGNFYGSGYARAIYADGAYPVTFYTNATERLRIDSSGKVGIGTSSPSRALHVSTSQDYVAKFSSTDAGSAILLEDGNSTANYNRIGVITHDMQFVTNNSERLRIDSSGNVGISQASPVYFGSGIPTLSLKGNAASQPTRAGAIVFDSQSGTGGGSWIYTDAGGMRFGTGTSTGIAASERMRIDSSGNVGIGTTSPSQKLHVVDTSNPASDGSVIIEGRRDGGANVFALRARDASAPTVGLPANQGPVMRFQGFNGTDFSDMAFIYAASGAAFTDGDAPSNLLFGTTSDNTETPTERMRIDSSGNVGIGTSSPNNYSGYSALTLNNATNGGLIDFEANGTRVSTFFGNASQTNFGTVTSIPLALITNNTERMRIDSSGNLLVGTTSGASGRIVTKGLANGSIYTIVSDQSSYGSGTIGHIQFKNSNGAVGQIQTSGSSTSYNTSSDYRLKENVVELTGATERLKQLNPSRFNFIADADTTVDGFLAHEVADVVPEAISGEKDAVDADGNPEYQGIDQSKLVPLLVATIQELEARITQLENN